MDVVTILAEFGFAITAVIGLGYFIWWIWTFVSTNIDPKIEEILINAALLPEHIVNIIHPNTAEETPGVRYINEKNDDGSLVTKYDEL